MKLNRIKDVLGEKGISQKWLAEKLNKSFNTVNAYVCNRQQSSFEMLYRIPAVLQVKARDLLVDNASKQI